jgi:hypothetical protein
LGVLPLAQGAAVPTGVTWVLGTEIRDVPWLDYMVVTWVAPPITAPLV